MINIWLIIKKELYQYYVSIASYVVIAIFIFTVNQLFLKNFFIAKESTIQPLFATGTTIGIPLLLVFLIPALTMHTWSEEKSTGTIELLMTYPIGMFNLIIGKFFATLIFVITMLLFTIQAPILALSLGSADIGIILMTYFGTILMASFLILLGQLVSLYNRSQILAFMISLFVGSVLYVLNIPSVANQFGNMLRPFIEYLSFGYHFTDFGRGVLDTRSILFFITGDVLMLILILRTYLVVKIEGH